MPGQSSSSHSTAPPASSTSSRPAAQSQAVSPRSKKASTRPAASQARSSAAAPARRMSRARGAARGSPRPGRRAAPARRRSRWPPAPARAARGSRTCRRASPRKAPSPRTARNVSPLIGRVHHAHGQAVAVLQRHAHRPGGEAVEEVDRAVERVHDPAPPARGPAARALLADQAVVRPLGLEQLPDRPLGLPIGVRDQIGRRRLRGDALGRPPVVAQQHLAGRARGPLGQLEIGAHRARRSSTPPTITTATTEHVEQEPKASCSERTGLSTALEEVDRRVHDDPHDVDEVPVDARAPRRRGAPWARSGRGTRVWWPTSAASGRRRRGRRAGRSARRRSSPGRCRGARSRCGRTR